MRQMCRSVFKETGLTCKVQAAYVLEQVSAIDRIHFGTETYLPRAELLVHVVEGVSHRIDGVDNKLDLSFLLVV